MDALELKMYDAELNKSLIGLQTLKRQKQQWAINDERMQKENPLD